MTSRETWTCYVSCSTYCANVNDVYICHCMYMFNLPLILIFNIYQLHDLHHTCETCYNSKIVPVNACPLISKIVLAKIVIYRYFLKLCWHVRLRSIPVCLQRILKSYIILETYRCGYKQIYNCMLCTGNS